MSWAWVWATIDDDNGVARCGGELVHMGAMSALSSVFSTFFIALP